MRTHFAKAYGRIDHSLNALSVFLCEGLVKEQLKNS